MYKIGFVLKLIGFCAILKMECNCVTAKKCGKGCPTNGQRCGGIMYRFKNRVDIELNCVLYRTHVAQKFVQPCRPCDAFVFYTNGGHIFESDTFRIDCAAGDTVYIPHGASYTNYLVSPDTEYYQIDFSIFDGEKRIALCDTPAKPDRSLSQKYNSFFADTYTCYVKRGFSHVPYCIGNILKLISVFTDEEIEKKNTNCGIGRIANTLSYIEKYYSRNTPVTELAKISSTGVSNLEKVFKQCFDMSPSAYRNKIRIEYAKQFLARGCSIERTAELTGFSDRFYFSKTFKKFTGTTPRGFMNSYEILP